MKLKSKQNASEADEETIEEIEERLQTCVKKEIRRK